MKKKRLAAATLLMAFSVIAFAQDECKESNCSTFNNDTAALIKNKKGHYILPKKGDIALGFNAIPVIDFFYSSLNALGKAAPVNSANTLVGYTNNSSGISPAFNNQITGKYYFDSHTALRVRLGYNTMSGTITNPVVNDVDMYQAVLSGSPTDKLNALNQKVDDECYFSTSDITVSAGLEKRRGYGRLQGFYGAEFGVGFIKGNANVNYGNSFSPKYTTDYTAFNLPTAGSIPSMVAPTYTVTPGIGSTETGGGPANESRELSIDYNSIVTFGLRGFVGVEYFIFPKISIGAEFGWSYAITWQQGAATQTESLINGQTGYQDIITTNNGVSSTARGFHVDENSGPVGTPLNTDGLYGASGEIMLLFHF
jgi:hypothetical protein